GHIEVFALGGDGAIWHRRSKAGDDSWFDWTSMGGSDLVTGAAAIVWGDGHGEIFATDSTGTAWHDWSGDFPSGSHGWEPLEGVVASRPIPVRWPDGHVDVFGRGASGELVVSPYDPAARPPFSVLGAGTRIQGEPSVMMNPGAVGTKGPEIVARGS